MYSSILSFTSALDEGGWSTPRPGSFTPGKETHFPLYRRRGGPQGQSGRGEKSRLHRYFFCILLYSVLHPHLFLFLECPLFCLYLRHTKQISMPPAGFEPAIPASALPQTLTLYRSATAIRFNPRTFEPAASCYTDWAIPTHQQLIQWQKMYLSEIIYDKWSGWYWLRIMQHTFYLQQMM